MASDLCELLTGFSLSKVVVIDTETTGLDPANDELLSVAVVSGDGNVLYKSFVKPVYTESWPDAQAINGISPDMVADAPTAQDIAQRLSEYINDEHLVVGYNVEFDLKFIDHWAGVRKYRGFPPGIFDVKEEFSKVHGFRRKNDGYAWVKLSECAGFYGYSFDAHDSESDAVATAWCFRSLLEDAAYHRIVAERQFEWFGRPSVRQTNSTRDAIAQIVGTDGASMTVPATIVTGVVTRGKNKGLERREVEVRGKRVGILSNNVEESLAKSIFLTSVGDLPNVIEATAKLSNDGETAVCSVKICDFSAALVNISKASGTVGKFGVPGTLRKVDDERTRSQPSIRKRANLGFQPNTQAYNSANNKASASSAERNSDIQPDTKTPKVRAVPRIALAAFLLLCAFTGFDRFKLSVDWLMAEAFFVALAILCAWPLIKGRRK